MPRPPITPEQRAAALDRAVRAPQVHTEIRRGLKAGTMSLAEVLGRAATDDVVGKMPVCALLACLPGVGESGAAYIMRQLGIGETRRAGSLSPNAREALMGELPHVPPSLAPPPASPPRPSVLPVTATTGPEMVSAQDLIVTADYGQILIFSLAGEDEDERPEAPALRDAWQSGRFVGVRPGFLDLLTPGQCNWHTPFRLEIWSAEPPDDRGGWDHEVDADFDVPDGRVGFMPSGGGIAVWADIPAGRYRARISGRGFTALGNAGANGDDSYRLRLWPGGERQNPVLRKRWPGWDKIR